MSGVDALEFSALVLHAWNTLLRPPAAVPLPGAGVTARVVLLVCELRALLVPFAPFERLLGVAYSMRVKSIRLAGTQSSSRLLSARNNMHYLGSILYAQGKGLVKSSSSCCCGSSS